MSLDVRAGEVLGIYGFMGCGQIELARTLFGKLQAERGHARDRRHGRCSLRNTAAARRAGIAFVPESRRSMLFHHEPVYKNMSIAILERIVALLAASRGRARDRRAACRAPAHPAARASSALLGTLSGGNQQKVALAKWLTYLPQVLVLSEPTRGMDVGAKEDVVKIVRGLRDQGIGDRRGVDRAGDRAVAGRPHRGDEEGRDRRASSPTRRSARTGCWQRHEERSMTHDRRTAADATGRRRRDWLRSQMRNIAPFVTLIVPGRLLQRWRARPSPRSTISATS